MQNEFLTGLNSIMLLSNSKTFSLSAENPNGEKGGGAKAIPVEADNAATVLGKGWKVKPCIEVKAGETAVIADIICPGIIQHMWITFDSKYHRNLILKMYWDDESVPSVEVPIGDFFANMHGLRYPVASLPIAVNPTGGMNSYWQMPFKKSARITVTNDYHEDVKWFFYQITYTQVESQPDNLAYFHAQWKRTLTTRENPEHIILADVIGKGHYVGTAIGWSQMSNGWWGEGEIKFFIDDDKEYPTICGTGTEDYFGGAWCFHDTYNTPFLGYPLWKKEPDQIPLHGLYRWHIMDPIRFAKNLKVTIQALGWYPNRKYQPLTDDICSVAYWYQSEPHNVFPVLPDFEGRFPR